MYCQNCGKEVNESAAVCLACGVAVKTKNSIINKETNVLIIVASVLFPLLGVILYVIEPVETKDVAKPYLKASIISFIVQAILGILSIILFMVVLGGLLSVSYN